MKMGKSIAAVLITLACIRSANAITVDGSLDLEYGTPTAVVGYNPSALSGQFGSPGNENNVTAYNIYLTSQGGFVYGFLEAFGPTNPQQPLAGALWSNLYFGTPGDSGTSTIGFEIVNQRAFIPGVSGFSLPLNIAYATTNSTFEFALPESYFTDPLGNGVSAGFNPGDSVYLRLSQSFGYSVAGGPSYGDDRLGGFELAGAVPEPSTWALMLLGFAAVGFTAYRRSRSSGAEIVAA